MPKNTYRAATSTLVTTGTATKPFASIIGSATAKVTVTKIRITCPTTTAVVYGTIDIVKTSTATSGGTSATVTAVPTNTGTAGATAVVKSWTADGTAGALVGAVDCWRMLLQATTAAA